MRKYPWGTCEALSSEHSDFAALKKLLLETSFEARSFALVVYHHH